MPRLASNYLFVPKIQGNFASVPSSSALSITSDIDLMALVQVVNRKNASSFQTLIGKYNTTANQRSYRLCIGTDGTIEFAKSADGSSVASTNSSSTVPQQVESSPLWIRATWRASDGLVQFFTADPAGSTSEPTSWTQLGSDKSTTGGSIYSGTAQVGLGAIGEGTFTTGGRIYRAIIKNGIGGTKVLDVEFYRQPGGTTSFTESSSNAATVTVNTAGGKPAAVVGRAQSGGRTQTSKLRVTNRDMGSSLFFDGNTNSMAVNASAASAYPLVNFSLCFWIRAGIYGASDNVLYGEGSSSTDTPFFGIRAGTSSASVMGRLLYYTRDDSNVINVNGTNTYVLDNERHFVVFTDANGTLNMYVDGALDRTLSYTRGTLTLNRTSLGGLYRTGLAVPVKAGLDEVRVYNSILTLTQIQDMYYRNIIPASPYREWLMNEGSGTTLTDTSGNGGNLSAVSAFNWVSGQFLNARTQVV